VWSLPSSRVNIGLLVCSVGTFLLCRVDPSIPPYTSHLAMASSLLRLGALLLGAVHSVTAVPVELNGRGM
jgi:hypothetical protein